MSSKLKRITIMKAGESMWTMDGGKFCLRKKILVLSL